VQDLDASQSRRMYRVDSGTVGGSERDVDLTRLRAAGRAEPEVGCVVGAAEADNDRAALWEPHHLAHP
jgi:hypothetical protein